MCEDNLGWTNYFVVSTEGGRSISGCYGGLQSLKCIKAPDALWTQCIIHREDLASKHLSPPRNLVLEIVLKVVNYIKTRPQKTRSCKRLCEDVGSDQSSLLYFCS